LRCLCAVLGTLTTGWSDYIVWLLGKVVFSYALVNYSVLGSKEERRQMSQNVTNELIYDVLKQLQADVAEVKATLADHTRQFIRVREDINTLRGDDLRRV
jgi:hypothetical protein